MTRTKFAKESKYGNERAIRRVPSRSVVFGGPDQLSNTVNLQTPLYAVNAST